MTFCMLYGKRNKHKAERLQFMVTLVAFVALYCGYKFENAKFHAHTHCPVGRVGADCHPVLSPPLLLLSNVVQFLRKTTFNAP